MPTKREREYYRMGFADAMQILQRTQTGSAEGPAQFLALREMEERFTGPRMERTVGGKYKPKRKLSPWNKFVKANSKKPRFIYKSGSNKGKLNLKKMGVAFRKTPAGKRKK